MTSIIHATGHGLSADDPIRFGNVLPTDTGIDETATYYVLAAGLTADDFEFSVSIGGAAFALAHDITNGSIRSGDDYAVVSDGVMDPPTTPTTPTSLAWTSAVVLDADGHQIIRIDITLAAAADPKTRVSRVTLTGPAGNPLVVDFQPTQTSASLLGAIGNVSYSATAVAFDVYGNASASATPVVHTTAKDTTAPAVPTGLAAANAILGIVVVWTSNPEADFDHYDVLVDDDVAFGSPLTLTCRASILSVTPLTAPDTYYVKVRAVDTSGNASAYCTAVSADARLTGTTDLDPTAIINQATNLINGTATVKVDDAGLHILDGALFLEDEFGSTVLVASGFSGSWWDFINLGLYNASLTGSDLAAGGTITNARSAHLAYWTVADLAVVGTATFLDPGVKVVFSALNGGKTFTSDVIKVRPGTDEMAVVVDFGWHFNAGSTAHLEVTGEVQYDDDPAFPSWSSGIPKTAGVVLAIDGNDSTGRLLFVDEGVPFNYARLVITVKETTAHHASNYVTLSSASVRYTPGVLGDIAAGADGGTSGGAMLYVTRGVDPGIRIDHNAEVTGDLIVDGLVRRGGTSFPASPNPGDTFFRTDYGLEFYHDGTRWVSMQLFHFGSGSWAAGSTYTISLTGSQATVARISTDIAIGTDIWLVSASVTGLVASGGSALGASHKWVATINKVSAANAATSLGTISFASGLSAPTWHNGELAIGALLGTYVSFPHIRLDWARTGTPGDLNITTPFIITFRVVAT